MTALPGRETKEYVFEEASEGPPEGEVSEPAGTASPLWIGGPVGIKALTLGKPGEALGWCR